MNEKMNGLKTGKNVLPYFIIYKNKTQTRKVHTNLTPLNENASITGNMFLYTCTFK